MVQNVTLQMPIFQQKSRGKKARGGSAHVGGQLEVNKKRSRMAVTALQNVSFSLHKGDRVALLGRNGAGKSTLLRTLAGIYEPSQGQVYTKGRVAPLFSATLGLNVNANGYENIQLAGRLLGQTRLEREAVLDDIVEFSELEGFLEMPLRTYSQGMRMRLSFGIATSLNPDILLIDEVIGAGDAHFKKQAQARVEKMMETTSVLVMASHSDDMLRKFCNKGMWIDHGELKGFGPLDDIIEAYHTAYD